MVNTIILSQMFTKYETKYMVHIFYTDLMRSMSMSRIRDTSYEMELNIPRNSWKKALLRFGNSESFCSFHPYNVQIPSLPYQRMDCP